MLQLIYVSSATQVMDQREVDGILRVSRRNNARDHLTGMLYADERRFLQVLEGEDAAVATTIERIKADKRHRALVVLSKRVVAEREFGAWEMAQAAPGHDADALMARITLLTAAAAPGVRATFEGFVATRRAA
ncbi:BLUF domain-containing protein [Sphingomonas sp.]|uniref:BLUF domain-containing protein n=1 Tax=Sphingomonas sp. TaxID=28214 RepID=UPI002C84C6EB|nr:BLUF domain-containing protein [Sphingomonas sp.]HTG37550.1 BLUF domain-containing protein [Sphingomonas sp.]